jgi:hypothetical protein
MPTCPALIRRLANACFVLALLTSWCSLSLAQQPPCTVPVNVVAPDLSSLSKDDQAMVARRWRQHIAGRKSPAPHEESNWDWQGDGYISWLGGAVHADWELLRALQAKAFVAQNGKQPLRIQAVTTDRSARRIIFVVENGKRVNADARKLESGAIADILSKARPEDTFGLLTARGPRISLPLGSSLDALRAASEQIAALEPADSGKGVLDSVLEASTWFQPPQPGDSIFLMTLHVEGGNHVSFSKVQAALGTARIRVFGFMLGPYYTVDWKDTNTSFAWYYPKTYALTGASGGLGGQAPPWGTSYSLTKVRDEVRDQAEMMYNAVTEYYLLQFDSAPHDVTIDLAPQIRDQQPLARVLYPRCLPPCSGTAAAKPFANGSGQ